MNSPPLLRYGEPITGQAQMNEQTYKLRRRSHVSLLILWISLLNLVLACCIANVAISYRQDKLCDTFFFPPVAEHTLSARSTGLSAMWSPLCCFTLLMDMSVFTLLICLAKLWLAPIHPGLLINQQSKNVTEGKTHLKSPTAMINNEPVWMGGH